MMQNHQQHIDMLEDQLRKEKEIVAAYEQREATIGNPSGDPQHSVSQEELASAEKRVAQIEAELDKLRGR